RQRLVDRREVGIALEDDVVAPGRKVGHREAPSSVGVAPGRLAVRDAARRHLGAREWLAGAVTNSAVDGNAPAGDRARRDRRPALEGSRARGRGTLLALRVEL